MKKVLLGTTALVGMVMFAQAAQAQVTVKVGGFVGFQAGFFDAGDDDESGRDFQSESEITVSADGKADNGLLYGAKVEMQTSTSDSLSADETVLYVAGDWGRLEFGDEDGAADRLAIYAPVVGLGQIDGAADDWVGDLALATFRADDTSDATKITYFSPRVAGFQAAASYVPETSSNGEGIVTTDAGGGYEDVVETGVSYQGEFSGAAVAVAGTYVFGDDKPGTAAEDLSAWNVGAQVGFGGFTVGGGYVDNGDSGQALGATDMDVTAWNAGVTYAQGPWGVGVSYNDVDRDAGGDQQILAFGATYTIAPGLTTSADLHFFDVDDGAGVSTDGHVLVLETKVTF